jgi:hypothetical protein
MISLYEFLEKKQIIYKWIDTENWDGVVLIDSWCHSEPTVMRGEESIV